MTLAADVRAFGAAALKQWRQVRRYPMWPFGLFFWPILLPAVYVAQAQAYSGGDPASLAAFHARTGTSEVAGFVFVGWALYMWLSLVLWGPGTSPREEQVRGSLEAVFLTPASRLVILFGPPAAHLIFALLNFAVMWGALRFLFGVELGLDATLRALAIVALTVPAMYGLGAIFASAVLKAGEVSMIVQLVRGAFSLLCGITYPIAMLPDVARAVALLLPPTYFVADVRAVHLARAELASLGPDLILLVSLGAALCAIAVVVFRAAERGARRSGMLARF